MYALNSPSLDYVTITTFDPTASKAMGDFVEPLKAVKDGKRRLQYVGMSGHHETGTAFVGTAMQRGKLHTMLQVSGLLSESAFLRLVRYVASGAARITRIDIQVTVPYDREEWSQASVFETVRAAAPNRSVSFAESQSGPQGSKLATVYFGSRQSDRLVRLYEKMGLGEEVYIRFECEYKGGRARAVGHELAKGLETAQNLLAGEILRFPHDGVQRHFGDHLADPLDVKMVSEAGNTKRWLLETVIPSLDRFLNDHDANQRQEVADAFWRVLADHLTRD